eukprot:scaffold2910_cov390-Prasinococcus_capsulatus_cf.AAC.28
MASTVHHTKLVLQARATRPGPELVRCEATVFPPEYQQHSRLHKAGVAFSAAFARGGGRMGRPYLRSWCARCQGRIFVTILLGFEPLCDAAVCRCALSGPPSKCHRGAADAKATVCPGWERLFRGLSDIFKLHIRDMSPLQPRCAGHVDAVFDALLPSNRGRVPR